VRPLPSALALAGSVVTAVALCGCASSVQQSGSIAGAASGSASAVAEPTISQPTNVASLPADLHLEFTDPQLSGASEAIYAAAEAFAQDYEQAASEGKITDPGLAAMMNAAAAAGVARTVGSDDRSGRRWAGIVSFTDFQVALLSKASGIGFCESDVSAYPVSITRDTREGSSPTGAGAVRAWELTVAKEPDGNYQITSFNTISGDSACL
jgi:hypothetical protein